MSSDYFAATFEQPPPSPHTPDLTKFTTRELLTVLRRAVAILDMGEQQIEQIHWDRAEADLTWMWEWDKAHFEKISSIDITGPNGGTFTVAEIKAELAPREHIPNKPEAKELRRQRAKRGRRGGRRDR